MIKQGSYGRQPVGATFLLSSRLTAQQQDLLLASWLTVQPRCREG